MALKATKTDARKIVPVLEGDYDTAEEAAGQVLLEAWDLYEKKAKYVVVAQVNWGHKYQDQTDINDARVCLGPFNTWTQAERAGESLAISHSTGAEAKWVIVEYHHGTPASYYEAKAKGFAERNKEKLTSAEGLSALLRDRINAVDDMKHNLADPWTITEDGEVALDEDAAERRIQRAYEEFGRAIDNGVAPLISLTEAEALRGLIERSTSNA